MNHPSADLQKAVYGALAANTTLITALGGTKIFDHIPQKAAFPYLVIGQATDRDWSTSSEDGSEHRMTIHIWSGKSDRQEVYQLQQLVRLDLHDAQLSAQDHHLVNLRHEFSEVRADPRSDALHGIMRFRAITEPKA